jgi:hypothetical protein
MLEAHLAMTVRHVALGERLVAEQRERVAKRERDGNPVEQSRELLRLFEEVQELHLAHREKVRKELDEFKD